MDECEEVGCLEEDRCVACHKCQEHHDQEIAQGR